MKTSYQFLLIYLISIVSRSAFSQTVSCSDPFLPSDWIGIGPYEYTEDNQQGRVMSIWVDPENEDEIYIGTRGSGIWYTYDGGEHWANQTGFQLPATGAWSISGRRVIAGPTMLYASTQFVGSDRNIYGLGLIYSKNNGATWTRETSYPAWFQFNGSEKEFKKSDLEFSGTKLYMTNGKYLFQRQTSFGTDTWTSGPILDLDDISTKEGHYVAEIDFSPVDTNRAIVSSFQASEDDLLYTTNASSATPT
jgi:hypothetical protein